MICICRDICQLPATPAMFSVPPPPPPSSSHCSVKPLQCLWCQCSLVASFSVPLLVVSSGQVYVDMLECNAGNRTERETFLLCSILFAFSHVVLLSLTVSQYYVCLSELVCLGICLLEV